MKTDPIAVVGAHSDSPPSLGTGEEQSKVLPILVEVAEVTKVQEDIGTVRVGKTSRSDESLVQTIDTLEVVDTKRVPVGLKVDETVAAHYRGEIWVVPIYEERFVKQLFLVEEVHISKRVESFPREKKLSLRREELVIERFDPVTQQWVIDPT